jgi:enoyl-[acyl-carrier protein] reductase II
MKNIAGLTGTRYPLIQGAMAHIADEKFAAAVSNAGALGIIASGADDAGTLRKRIHRCRELTQAPFGVNIMLMSPYAEAIAQMIVEEKVHIVTTGAGNPAKYIPAWKAAGITVIPVIASSAHAMLMERAGADAVIAEGQEAGGHIGELTSMALIPQVVDAIKIPVIAAGGIADQRGVLAAFALGAKGIQLGTLLLASEECGVHENYKQLLMKARDIDTTVTGRNSGAPVRVLKNPMAKKYQSLEYRDVPLEELEQLTLGSLRRAVFDGDKENGSFMAGQIAGLVKEVRSLKVIIESLFLNIDVFKNNLQIL